VSFNDNSLTAQSGTYTDFNELTALGSETMTYDANGNLLSDSTTNVEYKYDAYNRLRQVLTDPGLGTVVVEDFDYDCENRMRTGERMNGRLPSSTFDDVVSCGMAEFQEQKKKKLS